MAKLETAKTALRGASGPDDGDRAIELAGEALEKFMEIANDADADEASVRRETARAHFVYGEALFRGAQAQNTVFAASRSHRFKKRRRSAWSRSKRPRPLPLQRRRR